jgi:hypothetical protein
MQDVLAKGMAAGVIKPTAKPKKGKAKPKK